MDLGRINEPWKYVILDKPWDFYTPRIFRQSLKRFDEELIIAFPKDWEIKGLAIINMLKHYGWMNKEEPSLIRDKRGQMNISFRLILIEDVKNIMKDVSNSKETKMLNSYMEEKDLTEGVLVHLRNSTRYALVPYSLNPREDINETILRIIKDLEAKKNG